MVRKNLEEEFRLAIAKDAPWALVNFLDGISTLEELEELKRLDTDGTLIRQDLILYYRGNLERWPNPQLPEGFVEKFPLVAARLDTPEKVRILLRGADFRDVDPMIMGSVFEDIIRRHEQGGENRVVYRRHRGDKWCDALRIVYHSQLPSYTLTKLLLPGTSHRGIRSDEGLYLDWGTKS